MSRATPRHEDIDVESGLGRPKNSLEPVLVNEGHWKVSRIGTYIQCRQWRVLEGKFRFFWDGRIMCGGGFCFWWYLLFYISAALIVFLLFEVWPYFSSQRATDYIFLTIPVLLASIGITSVFQVVLTDPGYVPRPPPEQRVKNLINYHVEKPPEAKLTKKYGNEVYIPFCETCCHLKPPMAEHCDYCDSCIEYKSHHCLVFGTCIGLRNYAAFNRFILASSSLLLWVTIISLMNFITYWQESGFGEAAAKSPTIFVVLISFAIPPWGFVSILYLLVAHLSRMVLDKDVLVKYKYSSPGFSESSRAARIFIRPLQNIYRSTTRSKPKSRIDPRAIVRVVALPKPLKRLQKKEEARKVRSVHTAKAAPVGHKQTRPAWRIGNVFSPIRKSRVFRMAAMCTAPRLPRPSPGQIFPASFHHDSPSSSDVSMINSTLV